MVIYNVNEKWERKIMITHGMVGGVFPFKFRQTHLWIHYWSGLAGEYLPVNMDGNENEQRSGYYMMAQWTTMINHGVIPTAWDNVQSVQAFPNPVEKPWFLMIFVPVAELEAGDFFPYQTCPTGKSQLQKSSVPFPGWGDPETRSEGPSRLGTLENTHVKCFLEVGIEKPLWKILYHQLGWWHSQYDGKNNQNVPNRQPATMFKPPKRSSAVWFSIPQRKASTHFEAGLEPKRTTMASQSRTPTPQPPEVVDVGWKNPWVLDGFGAQKNVD